MRQKLRRFAAVTAIAGAGGFMMQSPNFACESFVGESLFTAIDTCFIFDCQSGAFGGVFQPCGIALNPNPTDPFSGGPLFTDCVPGTNNPFQTGP